jgi:16S rRNA (guanine527-N7)-methyltransferase
MERVLAGRDVSRETWERLVEFEALVRRWNPAINLVSRASLDALWGRHIEDSAQVFAFCPDSARSWVDLGSGGGFPGIVVAILAKELRPDLEVALVESDGRKATFLRQVARELALQVQVFGQRIESLPGQHADVLSARALAPLTDLLKMLETHGKPDGIAIFQKGEHHPEEIAAARTTWAFDVDVLPSLLDPRAAILIVRNLERAQPK